MGRMFLLLLFAAVAGAASPAAAQCRLCGEGNGSDEGGDRPRVPVRIEVETSLDFGKVLLTGEEGGVARIAPDGSRATRGAIGAISGRTMIGEVILRGEPNRFVRVSIPRRIDLHGLAGGALSITQIASDLPSLPRLDGSGLLRIRLGGEVLISGEADGDYRGEIPITVDYL